MNPIIKLAASALPGEKKYILFAGAGVSKDAGYPTAWDLMLEVAKLLYAADNEDIKKDIDLGEWFLQSKYKDLAFSELIDRIYPQSSEQHAFLNSFLDNKEPGEAHKLIAEMARRGIIRAIVTTNFDHGIEKALIEKDLKPQVISTDEDLKNTEPLIHCKAIRIYKPHGDLGKGALRNTPKDIEKLSKTMEKELVRVLGEHGVLVLGYSGRDKGIQQVFEKRNNKHYPLFWVDPNLPVKEILDLKERTYIPCVGASQFITDYFELIEKIEDIAPLIDKKPTISDIEYAFKTLKEPISPLYKELLDKLFNNLEKIKPDYSKHAEYDDAIVEQIEQSLSISYTFIEASLIASKHKSMEAIKTIYDYFGRVLTLYSTPEGLSGIYKKIDFDGYKFLGFEMFVSFIAALIKFGNWEMIDKLLSYDIYVDRGKDSKYTDFVSISRYVRLLDEVRKSRLNLNHISIMAEILKDWFSKSKLNKLISFKEFIEADYFLFLRTICHPDSSIWCPRCCIYLYWIPSYLQMAESKQYLKKLVLACGLDNNKLFIERIKERHTEINKFFRYQDFIDPLIHFDFDKLGSRN